MNNCYDLYISSSIFFDVQDHGAYINGSSDVGIINSLLKDNHNAITLGDDSVSEDTTKSKSSFQADDRLFSRTLLENW